MRIYITNVFVDDQSKALDFYTNILGFELKQDVPLGEYRWLTITGKSEPDGPELLLEPAAHPAVAPYKAALLSDGIPAASFQVDNLDEEYSRLTDLGVTFTLPHRQTKSPPALAEGLLCWLRGHATSFVDFLALTDFCRFSSGLNSPSAQN